MYLVEILYDCRNILYKDSLIIKIIIIIIYSSTVDELEYRVDHISTQILRRHPWVQCWSQYINIKIFAVPQSICSNMDAVTLDFRLKAELQKSLAYHARRQGGL